MQIWVFFQSLNCDPNRCRPTTYLCRFSLVAICFSQRWSIVKKKPQDLRISLEFSKLKTSSHYLCHFLPFPLIYIKQLIKNRNKLRYFELCTIANKKRTVPRRVDCNLQLPSNRLAPAPSWISDFRFSAPTKKNVCTNNTPKIKLIFTSVLFFFIEIMTTNVFCCIIL